MNKEQITKQEILINTLLNNNNLIDEVSFLEPKHFFNKSLFEKLVELYNDKGTVTQIDLLLEGFEILVGNFQKGDSIVALIPSNLLFGRNGSFINQIPPFTPMKVNLKIN